MRRKKFDKEDKKESGDVSIKMGNVARTSRKLTPS